ncbi:MAG: zinc-binding dehydrogenase [Acidobacteria bacterium]|nr:zinc-binding dehydrogenase [Acidobacteriota bacterium]
MTSSKTVVVGLAAHRTEDLLVLKALVEAGEIRPVVDRRFPLERIAEAHAYVGMCQYTGIVFFDVWGGGFYRSLA